MTEVSGVDGRSDTVRCPTCGRLNRVRATAVGVPRCAACATALPWVTTADDRDFGSVVAEASLPVLLDLWAPWCGPCRVVAPGVERAAREFAGRLKAVKVDVDEAPGVAARYQAQSIPTVLLLDAGREEARQVGAVPPDRLVEWLKIVLNRTERPRPS
ncbi:MAG TPA: thioredoxin [Micromonosporaceae bacterium]